MSTLLSLRRLALSGLSAAVMLSALGSPAHAQSEASAASAVSLLPVAVSVGAPVVILAAGASLAVVAVEASAAGTVYVLERASDGARASLRFAGNATGALSVGVGTVMVVTLLSTGYLLSAAGEAIAFVPNQSGAALLYNERITR